MTPEQVSEWLNVRRKAIYRLIAQGELRAFLVGRSYRIDPAHVSAYLRKVERA